VDNEFRRFPFASFPVIWMRIPSLNQFFPTIGREWEIPSKCNPRLDRGWQTPVPWCQVRPRRNGRRSSAVGSSGRPTEQNAFGQSINTLKFKCGRQSSDRHWYIRSPVQIWQDAIPPCATLVTVRIELLTFKALRNRMRSNTCGTNSF